MSTYTVSGPQMLAAVDMADAMSQQLSATLTGLEQDLKATLASWTSDGQQAYQLRQSQWHQAAQNMPQMVAAAKQALSDIHVGYVTAENKVAQNFS